MRTDNHTSGGLTVLNDATLLFATGDNGFAGEDGFNYPQDSANHLGKILRINAATVPHKSSHSAFATCSDSLSIRMEATPTWSLRTSEAGWPRK